MKKESLMKWVDLFVMTVSLGTVVLLFAAFALSYAVAGIVLLFIVLAIGWMSGIRHRFIDMIGRILNIEP